MSHAALLDGCTHFDAITSVDVLLAFSSLYWVTGWFMLIRGTICGATRIITTETYTPELHLRLVKKYRVTVGLNAPHHLALVLKSDRLKETDLSSLKFQMVTGGKCSFNVQTGLNAILPNGKVHACYGLSESGGVMTANLSDTDSVGQVVSFHAIKIIDDNGNRCGIEEDGEICFKTNYRFIGYYDNQKATDDALDDEGFFLTADIGHFDKNGNLYIVDRKKDLIKYCGFQISPSEIESFLITSSDIKAACVIGIPDETCIDLPAAFIIQNTESTITEIQVFDMVANHFADYYKLRGGVYFVDALPMTPSGKMLGRKVREIALELRKQ